MSVSVKKRIGWVDIAKGITIVLVVFGHSLQGIVDSQNLSIHSNNSSIFFAKNMVYGFHMATFFLISGFFIGFLQKPIKIFLVEKIRRIAIPYFIWSFILALCMQIASKYTNAGLGLSNFLTAIWTPFSEYWYLYVLFFIYLIYYVVDKLIKQYAQITMLIIAFILFGVQIVLPNVWIWRNLGEYLLFFVAGNYVYSVLKRLEQRVTYRYLFVNIVFFLIVNYGLYQVLVVNKLWISTYYYLLTAIIGGSLVLVTAILVDRLRLYALVQGLKFLGKNSMQIYVMHLIPLAGIRILLLKIFDVQWLWMIVPLITIIALVLCIIGIKICDLLKLNWILFGENIK